MDIASVSARVAKEFVNNKQRLIDFVAIPSVSADAFDQSELDRSAAWVAQEAQKLGLETEIIKLKTASGLVGRPAILAHRPAEPGKPTVLLYAHHDVQPEGDLALWNTAPYEATEIAGRLFGRGAADDKAGVVLHLAAISAADPGVGITLFVEGEEEIGSPTFSDFLATYRDRLQADVVIVADSNNWRVGVPALTTSLRGVVQVEVELSVLDHALHSGMYSGPTIDAPTLAARLIATLHNEQGEVAVPGLIQVDETVVDYPEEQLRQDMGLLAGLQLTGTGSLTSRLWTKPTISLIGMDITPVDISSNTLIPNVRFALSMRVAPQQDPREAAQALISHLESNVPFGAKVKVTLEEAGPGFIADSTHPAFAEAKWALHTAWDGVEPVEIGVGGSIPFISDLAQMLPEAAILVTGVEDPDTRAHSANESLDLGDWEKAILAEALLLSKLGE
ncbi:MAG: dipeptidase [Arcanobacterium sp.]|nr:dipeptidase [Arcanobacterium sp.]